MTGKSVALEFLARESTAHEEARARFMREARAASMIDHPHVVAIHDVVELAGGLESRLFVRGSDPPSCEDAVIWRVGCGSDEFANNLDRLATNRSAWR